MRAVNFPVADLVCVDLDTHKETKSQDLVLGTIDGFLEIQRKFTEKNNVRLTVFLCEKVVTYEKGQQK